MTKSKTVPFVLKTMLINEDHFEDSTLEKVFTNGGWINQLNFDFSVKIIQGQTELSDEQLKYPQDLKDALELGMLSKCDALIITAENFFSKKRKEHEEEI